MNIHKNTWITANAGSGKTTELTRVVVKLMLLGVPPERIVCITYTKAAASEMRVRILKRLRELLMLDDAACTAYVEKEILHEKPTTEHMQRARNLFSAVLDSPGGGIQLTTIHGFCQDILRRFPLEAGIAPHFTVLEDAAADELLHRAKHALLQGLESAEPALANALDLIGTRGGESRFNALANDVIKQKRSWRSILAAQSEGTLRMRIYELHGIGEQLTEGQLREQLASAFGAAECALLRQHLPQLLAHKTKTYREFGEKLANILGRDAEALAEQWLDCFLTKGSSSEPRKARQRLVDVKQFDAQSPLQQLVGVLVARCLSYLEQLAALRCAEESYAIAIFADALLKQYDSEKANAQALDFDDLITRTLQLLAMPDMLGWVMSKLDHRIDHLLIDEAQDNSSEQWELARILVDELIATNDGVDSSGLPRSLLVVGDEKQSIYSFQGAAPEKFDANKQWFSRKFAENQREFVLDSLLNSWRSAPAILQLVDRVCALPQVACALTSAGGVQEHKLKREDAAGLVALYPLMPAPEKDKLPPMIIPIEYPEGGTATQHLADSIVAQISQWIDDKRPLSGTDKPVQPGDILILVRSRTRLVSTLIRTLQRGKIPVAGIDRLKLSSHLAVGDLLALMRWCTNIHDDLSLAQVLRSPMLGFSDEALRTIACCREGSLWAEVSGEARAWLHRTRNLSHFAPYDFLTHVLEVSGTRMAFARRFGEEVHEVLDELKQQAIMMPEGSLPTIAQFEDWMSGNRREIKRQQEEGGHDHVRIMTVHGAKGLEAPIVILADTVKKIDTSKERFFSATTKQGQPLPVLAISEDAKDAAMLTSAKQALRDKLDAEYYRLLYVAITRAKDELHIFGAGGSEANAKAGTWYDILATAMKEAGAVERDGITLLMDEAKAIPQKEPKKKELPTATLPTWANAAAPPVPITAASLAPSRLTATQPSPYAKAASADARTRGVRIHRILELLAADSDAEHIEQLVMHIAPEWNSVMQKLVAGQILTLFNKERWLWQGERWPEATIQGTIDHENVRIPVNGQIDLLLKTHDEVIILDYKTGAHVPATPADVPENYLLQLKLYHALVGELYPDMPIRTAILWTHNAQLMWLDEEVTAIAFPPLRGGNPPLAA